MLKLFYTEATERGPMNDGRAALEASSFLLIFISFQFLLVHMNQTKDFGPHEGFLIFPITDIPIMIMEVRRRGQSSGPRGILKALLHGRSAVGQKVAISVQLNTVTYGSFL
jgi:hypothetical protein